jgi:hypothetical protein
MFMRVTDSHEPQEMHAILFCGRTFGIAQFQMPDRNLHLNHNPRIIRTETKIATMRLKMWLQISDRLFFQVVFAHEPPIFLPCAVASSTL